MDKQLKKVYLSQGEGSDEIYMAIRLPEDIISKMAEIRRSDPKKWLNRELNLLRLAEEKLKNQESQ